jgi:uncharacterized protein (TIGR02246 family)
MHKDQAINSSFNHAAAVLTFNTPLRSGAATFSCDDQTAASAWLQQLNMACQQRNWQLLATQLSPQVQQVNLFGQAQQGIPALLQSLQLLLAENPGLQLHYQLQHVQQLGSSVLVLQVQQHWLQPDQPASSCLLLLVLQQVQQQWLLAACNAL